jgi:membrane-bound serine protease (ClpP class)
VKISVLLAALLAAIVGASAFASTPATTSGKPRVLAITFNQEIDSVTASWLNSKLDEAHKDGYNAAVILLDTPGGDEDSMRSIVQKELQLSSEGTPVVVYVSPNGARAASAGVWVSQAADVLAMAPETNIGASTPIDSTGQNIGGSDLRRKVINDAVASLTALATAHHRNAGWVALAVTKADSITAAQALKLNVIDLVSPSLPALLNTIDGRVTVSNHLVLHTANAAIDTVKPGFLTRFLSTLLNPNIVSLLFLAGLAGIGFEIFHPGVILPGALGATALILAFFGLYVLPLSWTGIALVILGVVLLLADAHYPTHGALTLAGLLALGFGLATMFQSTNGAPQTSVPLVVAITLVLGGLWAFGTAKAIAIRRAPASVGPERIVGAEGVVREGGMVYVNGELWRARAGRPLRTGQRVHVDALEGLTLEVHEVSGT